MRNALTPVRVLAAVVIGLTAAVGGVAWFSRRPLRPPDRPKSVPTEAVWVGASKGEWIHCRTTSDPRLLDCALFNDVKGEKISSGRYRWEHAGSDGVNGGPRYRFYDGQVIHLENGQLVPIGEHVYYLAGGDTFTKNY